MDIYVIAFDGPEATSSSTLLNPPFLINFIQSTDKGALNEGSLHSTAFRGKVAGSMAMGEIRKLIKKM